MRSKKPWYLKAVGTLVLGVIAFCVARFFIGFVRREVRHSKALKQQEGLFI